MLDDLKEEGIVNKVGGRFKLSTLIQKRMVALNTGAKPLIDARGIGDKMQIVLREILEDKIFLDTAGNVNVNNATMMANIPGAIRECPACPPRNRARPGKPPTSDDTYAGRRITSPQCHEQQQSDSWRTNSRPADSAHARHCSADGRIDTEGPRGVSTSLRQ